MGRRPGSWAPPAWGGPWKGLLLAASVLGSCLQPAQTQTPVTIVFTPRSPEVGGNVSLAPQPTPQGVRTCSWFRSATDAEPSRIFTYLPPPNPVQQNGLAHTGRETAGPGCVLHIERLMLNYTGNYMVQIVSLSSSVPVLGSVHLRVYASAADSSGGLSPGAIAGIVIGSLAAAALLGGLLYFLLCRTGGGPKQHSPVGGQAAPAHNEGVGGSKPTLGEEDIQYSTLAFSAGDQKPPPGPQTPPEGGTVYSEIRKK